LATTASGDFSATTASSRFGGAGLLKRDYGFDAAELDTRTRAWIMMAA
jgi:hypothetical protein